MVRGLAESLSREGVETHVATTNDNGPETTQCPMRRASPAGRRDLLVLPKADALLHCLVAACDLVGRHVSEFDLVHIHALFSFSTLPAAFWAHRRRCALHRAAAWHVERVGNEEPPALAEDLVFSSHRAPGVETRRARALHERAGATSKPKLCRSRRPPPSSRTRCQPLPRTWWPASFARDTRSCSTAGSCSFSRASIRRRASICCFPRSRSFGGRCPTCRLVLAGAGDAGFVSGLKAEAESLGIARDVDVARLPRRPPETGGFCGRRRVRPAVIFRKLRDRGRGGDGGRASGDRVEQGGDPSRDFASSGRLDCGV